MSTPWKNHCRIKARKLLKSAGLDEVISIKNKEDMLSDDEIGLLTTKDGNALIPFTRVEAALANSDFRIENINDVMAVLKLRKHNESKVS